MIKAFLWRSVRRLWGSALVFVLCNVFLVSIFTLPFCPKRSIAMAAILCGMGGCALIMKWRCLSRLLNDCLHHMRCHMFGYLLRQDLNYFQKNTPSELAPQLTYDLTTLGETLTEIISRGTFYGLLLGVSTVALVALTHQFLFAVLLLTPGLFAMKTNNSAKPMVGLTNYLYEVFGQLRTIFALNHQNFDQLVFEKWSLQIAASKHRQAFKSSVLYIGHLCITGVIIASIVLLGVHFMQTPLHHQMHVVPYVAYALFGVFFSLTMLNALQKPWGRYQEIKQNMAHYFDTTPKPVTSYKQLKIYPARGLLAIHNVSFAYPCLPDKNVIHDFNFSICPGETLAILGASGSGKSTLLNLLMGFYPVSVGNIYLDGLRIQDMDPEDLRTQVALMDQEPQFFTASIYENILYGNPKATDQQLQDLIDQITPPQWIDSFPKGLHTVIGPRGLGLSVGQKQMIALLRVLLRNPSVLLLDEATSGLDYDTENHVMRTLRPILKNKTTVMVTHKLAQIDLADRIIVLHKGSVVGFGNHQMLFNENIFYRKLITSEVDNTPLRAYE